MVSSMHNSIPQFPIYGPSLLASLLPAILEVYQEPCMDGMISLGNDKRKEQVWSHKSPMTKESSID